MPQKKNYIKIKKEAEIKSFEKTFYQTNKIPRILLFIFDTFNDYILLYLKNITRLDIYKY